MLDCNTVTVTGSAGNPACHAGHLDKQREKAAQRLLQQLSEARHAFNQSAHEMYNEVVPPLLAGVVHLIGNCNGADLVAFIGRSNTATVVGKLGSSSNVAVLEEIGPGGMMRVAGKPGDWVLLTWCRSWV
jgi:hypothetical protein